MSSGSTLGMSFNYQTNANYLLIPVPLADPMFMFPLGFNLNDFKNAMNQRGNPAGGNTGGASVNAMTANSFASLGGLANQQQQQIKEEDSVDNNTSSTSLFQTLSSFTAPNPDLVQANLEKMMVSDALEVIGSLPLELTNNGSENDDSEMIKGEPNDMDIDMDEYLQLSDICPNSVLPDFVIPFSFKLPNSVPPYLNAHYTCETGSRLLFSSVLWLSRVPVFQQLPEDMQNALIKAAWAEIFILNFVQMSGQLSFNAVMSALVEYFNTIVDQNSTPTEKLLTVSDNISLFNEFVRDTNKLQLDDFCFSALRLILLFNASGVRRDFPQFTPHLDAVVAVASQELRRQLGMNLETSDEGVGSEELFVKVVMKVATLSKFNAGIVEELFFTMVVGQVSVENMIPYILRLGHSNVAASGMAEG